MKDEDKRDCPLFSQELERRLSTYLYLKGKGLTLEEIRFLSATEDAFPQILKLKTDELSGQT